jgi:glutamate N-acetyltransferase/amino-acid N-acetyltransferase
MEKAIHVPIPKGFLFSTAEAAIKKPGRQDIALIVSDVDSNIAGAFTTNAIKAAPVKLCMHNIRSGRGRVIVVNSGNANACTGAKGLRDAEGIVANVARKIGITSSLAYICSTGVIGTPLPMQRIEPALGRLLDMIGNASFEDVAKAIMTTDTFPKIVSKKVKVEGKWGTIAGICKGAGMIAPNMATMLCFILTDIAVEKRVLNTALKEAVNKSFNRITIDGDMSTNDTVLLMANGVLGNAPLTRNSPFFSAFSKVLDDIAYDLSRLVVKDAEGATKLIEVVVRGAKSDSHARKAAFAIADSNLVKTAIYGNDANWGRIMCALGYSGIPLREERIDIFLGRVHVVKKGLSNGKEEDATAVLKSKEITIIVDLHTGNSAAKVLTCDFTEEYVRINAEYRT